MRVLARRLAHVPADPLWVPWAGLRQHIAPRPGNLIIALAAPGVGKSTLGLEWTLRLVQSGEPSLYMSLDTPLQDQAARLVARINQIPVSSIYDDKDRWAEWLTTWNPPLRFSDLPTNVEGVRRLVEAERLWFGEYPRLIVVDNVLDLIEGEETVGEFRRVFAALHSIARETDAVVLALHHLRRGGSDLTSGRVAPSIGDGLYSGEQTTPIMLGLWRPDDPILNVSILKNRMGPADPSGGFFVSLGCDMSWSAVWDHQEVNGAT